MIVSTRKSKHAGCWRWRTLTIVLVAMLGFTIGNYSLQSRAGLASFSPGSCTGGWRGVDRAAGLPDANGSYTADNSAMLYDAVAELNCGDFAGDVPDDTAAKTFRLRFSWQIQEESAAVSSVTETEGPDPKEVIELRGSDIREQAKEILDAPSDRAVNFTVTPEGDGTVIETVNNDAESKVPEAVKPEGGGAGVGEKESAPTVDLEVKESGPNQEEKLPETSWWNWLADRVWAADQETLESAAEIISRPNVPIADDWLELVYRVSSTDNLAWEHLAFVNRDNWQDGFTLPLANWSDLKEMQIGVRGLSRLDAPVRVWLDAMWVEMAYDRAVAPELTPAELALLPRVEVPSGLILDFNKTDLAAGESVVFQIADSVGVSDDVMTTSTTSILPDKFPEETSVKLESGEPPAQTVTEATSTLRQSDVREMDASQPLMVPVSELLSALRRGWSRLGSLVVAAPGINDVPEPKVVKAELSYLSNGKNKVEAKVSHGLDGWQIGLSESREFRPGAYRLHLEVLIGDKVYVTSADFTWGVLAINTDRSIYALGDTAYLQMAALNNKGNTLCDADLLLEITDPDAGLTTLSSENGRLLRNQTCGANNVTDEPDYYALFTPQEVGEYHLHLTNLKTGHSLTDSFSVKQKTPLTIKRVAATRINPFKSTYKMRLTVEAAQDFSGTLTELVPTSFKLVDTGRAREDEQSGVTQVFWEVNLKAGEKQEFYYVYRAPKISPEFFLLGPASLTGDDDKEVFRELRQWQLASDALTYTDQWGTYGTGNGEFDGPKALAVNYSDTVYVIDANNCRVQYFQTDGSYLGQWGVCGTADGEFQFSSFPGIAIDPLTDNVYVSDDGNNRIQYFDSGGTYLGQWGTNGTGDGEFDLPAGLATDGSLVYVADVFNYRVQVFDMSGNYVDQFGVPGSGNGEFDRPVDVDLDASGNIYVMDWRNYRVQVFDSGFGYQAQWGTTGTGNGQFNEAYALVVEDFSTDDINRVNVLDGGNCRIQRFDFGTNYLSQGGACGAGNGQLDTPYGIAVDPNTHIVFVADTNNNRIQKFDNSINISGNIYQSGSESTTNATSVSVSVSVNNGTPTTVTGQTGSYSFSNIVADQGDVIAVYIDGHATLNANTFVLSDGIDMSNLHLYINKTSLGANSLSSAISNSAICAQTSYPPSGDNLFTCSSSVPTFTGDELHINGYYAPGTNANAPAIHIASSGYYNGGTETLTLTSTSTTLFTREGSFAAFSNTVVMNPDASVTLTNATTTTFNKLTLSPTLTSTNRTYTLGAGALTMNGNLTITPTSGSSRSLTVNMGANITVAASATTTISGSGAGPATANLDTTGGNYSLSSGRIDIGSNGTLTGNASTITLTGTSGTLLTRTGTLTPGSSTVVMNPNASVTLTSGTVTFNNLTLSPTLSSSGKTYTFGSGAITTNGNFTINPSAASSLDLTVNMGAAITVASTATTTIAGTGSATSVLDPKPSSTAYNLTSGRLDIQSGGTLDSSSANPTITLNGTSGTIFTNAGTFTAGSSTVRFNGDGSPTSLTSGSITFNELYLSPTLTADRTYTFGTGTTTVTGATGGLYGFYVQCSASTAKRLTINLGGPLVVNKTALIQPQSSSLVTIDTGSNQPFYFGQFYAGSSAVTLNANGSDLYSTYYGSSGAVLRTNGGTFNAGTSTVHFQDGTASRFFSDNYPITFYNLVFDGTVPGSVGYGNGTATTTVSNDMTFTPLTSGVVLTLNGPLVVGGTTTISGVSGGYTYLDTNSSSNQPFTSGAVVMGTSGSRIYGRASTITLTGTSGTLFTINSGIFVQGTSEVKVTSASGTPTLLGGSNPSFYKLTIDSTATVVNMGPFIPFIDNISGSKLYIKRGVFNASGAAIGGPGSSNGTLQIDSGATLCLGGTTAATTATCDSGATDTSARSMPNFQTYTFDANSTVRYLSNAAQTISNTPTYGNLVLSPTITSGRTYTFGGATTINGNFTINPSAATSLGLTVNPAGHITVASTATTTIGKTSSATSVLDLRPVSTDYNLTTGHLDIQSGGTLDASSAASAVTVRGNWTKAGTFTPGSSTVYFSGSGNQNILNSTTWYSLVATTTLARALTFTAGTTQTIGSGGSANFSGAAGQLLTLQSSTPSSDWFFSIPSGSSRTVNYTAAIDANANDSAVVPTNSTCTRTTNWSCNTLGFSISANSASFGTLTTGASRYASSTGAGNTSEVVAHTIEVSNDANSGYVLTVRGASLTHNASSTIDIDVIGGTAVNPSAGTEQFGLRITASGGSGVVTSPYNDASKYAYAASSGTASQIASASGSSATTTYSVRYMANIAAQTPAGSYSTSLTYILTPTY